jgi:hypothetical protein
MMRPFTLLTLWLLACTDGPVDSDPNDSDPDDSDTGDCADGYDVETYIAQHLERYCRFVVSCPDTNTSYEICMAGMADFVSGNPCYQPCNARACTEALQAEPTCSSFAQDAPDTCKRISECPDEQ